MNLTAVNFTSVGVRPVVICDLSSSDLSVGDQISLADYSWTVICVSNDIADDPYNGDAMILCDDFVGYTCFREDYSATDSTEYDASDVKQWLANWVASHPFWTKTVTVALVN
jgi:proteasome lid subunit RPN8/RPN11